MRFLSKLIPRSSGGRWAAGLGAAAVVGVGIYLVFFVFAFHLIFVDEVVDEEGPEFAVEADIDELIAEAREAGSGTADAVTSLGADDAAQAADAEDTEVTEQAMTVGEHSVDEVDAAGDSPDEQAEAPDDAAASDQTADAAGDGAGDSGSTGDSQTAEDSGSSGAADDGGVRVAYVGSFGPRSHPAEGTAAVLTDGTQTFLRFDDDFATDNGPDLNVYLHTAGPEASVDDLVSDFIDLGDLKGNIGAQNYLIPQSVDLNRYNTVSVWCVRFRVVFGTAELAPMS